MISDWSAELKRIPWIMSIAAIYATVSLCFGSPQRASLADLPDTLVGTDSSYELSRGNTYPAVLTPFGMIAWTAQTGEGGWPYQYSRGRIRGFLATHRPSAWTDDYGPFSLMPLTSAEGRAPRRRDPSADSEAGIRRARAQFVARRISNPGDNALNRGAWGNAPNQAASCSAA